MTDFKATFLETFFKGDDIYARVAVDTPAGRHTFTVSAQYVRYDGYPVPYEVVRNKLETLAIEKARWASLTKLTGDSPGSCSYTYPSPY